MVIGIIGAGASGMAAALSAAENRENQVTIFERQSRVGRKLLATGNGRCNLTNLHATESGYYGVDASFVSAALKEFGVDDTLEWFASLGLYTVAEESGRVYPYSDQANSVVDILRYALQKENIQLLTGCEVSRIRKSGTGFTVQTQDDAVYCDKLIVACGGLAGTKLGGSMSGYKLLRSLGHSCTKLRPALVQLKSDWHGCKSLKGVRANCHAVILKNGSMHAQSKGEIQFTEYGLSGPVVFEISRDVCSEPAVWSCRLDFLPDMETNELLNWLSRRPQQPAEELLTGILHNRLGRVLTSAAGVRADQRIGSLTDEERSAVCNAVKNFEILLTEPMGMDSAQVTAGGILTSEFDPHTMESRFVPNLYACGEVLDIDGACGGYNLQWAWSSGRLAGKCAGGNE